MSRSGPQLVLVTLGCAGSLGSSLHLGQQLRLQCSRAWPCMPRQKLPIIHRALQGGPWPGPCRVVGLVSVLQTNWIGFLQPAR